MNLIELSKLLLDEKLAEEYLLEKGILKTFKSCERCGSEKLGRIRRGRYKCYGCKSEWGPRSGSILHGQNITSSKFIGLLKLFELEHTAKQSAINLDLDLKTTKNLFHKVRLRISNMSEEEYLNHCNNISSWEHDMLISTTDRKIKIEMTSGTEVIKELSKLKKIPFNYRGVEYSFQFNDVKARKIKQKGKYYPIQINYFWRYVIEKLEKHHGISTKSLFLYLKEMEYRYNNRFCKNMFDKIVGKLAIFKGGKSGSSLDKL